MTFHDFIVQALGGTSGVASPRHVTLVGANLGLTLWMVAIDVTVLLYTGAAAWRELWARRVTTPSIVCIMSSLVAIGQLIFHSRRIGLLVVGAEISRTQPDWSVIAVMVGSGFITSALVAGIIWRAAKLRPGTGRWVAILNIAAFAASMCGGAIAAAP